VATGWTSAPATGLPGVSSWDPSRWPHSISDPVAVRTFWQQLIQADRGLNEIPVPLQGQGRLSAASLELRTFAARLRLTHLYFEADSIAGQALMRAVQVETGDLPVVITPYKVMRRTTAEIMARELGLSYRRAANQ
jgi:hypothetical protein